MVKTEHHLQEKKPELLSFPNRTCAKNIMRMFVLQAVGRHKHAEEKSCDTTSMFF
jgi:hypothetical protein